MSHLHRSKDSSNKQVLSPPSRVVQPGAFSAQHYDHKLTASHSNITPFNILNPTADPNVPKVPPTEIAAKKMKKTESSPSSIKSTSPVKLNSDRKRPTSAYINKSKSSHQEPSFDNIDPYGQPIPSGRKCIVELEEELIAKTIQLHRLTVEAEHVRTSIPLVLFHVISNLLNTYCYSCRVERSIKRLKSD